MNSRNRAFVQPPHPIRFLAAVLSIVFLSEVAVHLLARVVAPGAVALRTLIDACALTAILAPLTWWFVVRPLREVERLRSEEHYGTIVRTALDGFWLSDTQGRLLDVNEAYCHLTGYTRDELLAMSVPDLDAVEAPEETGEHIRRVMDVGGDRFETRHRCKDGTVLDIEVSARYTDADGGRLFVFLRDTTDRKRAEEQVRALSAELEQRVLDRTAQLDAAHAELRDSEEALRAVSAYTRSLIETSLDPLVTISPEGKITDVNRATEDATGMPRDALVGTEFSEYFTEPEKARDGYQLAFTQGSVMDYPLAIRHTSGRVMDVVYNASVYRDQAGNVIGLFAAARDVTERKRAERTVRESEERFRTAFEDAAIGMGLVGLDGRFLRVNRSLCGITGYTEEKLLGLTFQEITHPEDLGGDLGYISQLVAGEIRKYDVEKRYLHSDGHIVWILLSRSVVRDAEGKPVHFITQIQDITNRKAAEALTASLNQDLERRAAELEAANKELESFSYSVSHDLRAPLRAVDGFSRILVEDHSGQLGEEGERMVGVIRSEAERMGRLVDDLLAFSRMGRATMQGSRVDMGRLAEAVLQELRAAAPERRIEATIGRLPLAQGDPAMLRQALTNLLGNAVKFTRHKETAAIEVGFADGDGENTYWVKDNGAGFDMRYADKLFGVFQRLHSEREFEGTGIGLALLQRVIHRHGGRVWAEGKVGEGATFYFTLPKGE